MKKIIVVFMLILSILIFSGCTDKTEIIIGLSVTLSGTNSAMGHSVKDGVILAVDKINQKGGINGKMIKLIVKDDKNDAETAIKVDRELIDADVILIIGHITSELTKAVLPMITEENIFLMSPTINSTIVNNDDRLISLNSINLKEHFLTAEYAIEQDNVKRLSIIYDVSNRLYSENWVSLFRGYYEEMGGHIVNLMNFNSNKDDVDYYSTVKQLCSNDTEGVLIIAAALNTITLAQQIEKIKPEINVFSNGWAKEPILIEYGGSSVEGLVLSSKWNNENERQSFKSFRKIFLERYGNEPSFPSAAGYECIQILYNAIKSTESFTSDKIFDTIIETGKFEGINQDILINSNGATDRKVYLFRIENGRYKLLKSE